MYCLLCVFNHTSASALNNLWIKIFKSENNSTNVRLERIVILLDQIQEKVKKQQHEVMEVHLILSKLNLVNNGMGSSDAFDAGEN